VRWRIRYSSSVRPDLKLITAIIKPFKIDEVREALSAVGVRGITLTEVQGFGRQRGHVELYRSAEYMTEWVPKLKLQVAVDDDNAEAAQAAIESAAWTGRVGDGKLFVFELRNVLRIRTRESGEDAM
jgi:nitrogen regulatory protein P-II 2